MDFLIQRCLPAVLVFCISSSISAADLQNDLPEDLKQIRNYFNNPPAITNLTFVMTNYISRPFLNDDEIREAMKNGYNPNKPRVSYWAYSSDPKLPGIVFRSFPAKYFDANHNLTNLAILTNYPAPSEVPDYSEASVFYGGRIGGDWWKAGHEEIHGLFFDVLTNSVDGTKLWDTNSTQISTHFRDFILGSGSVFQHFGYGMFEAGTWQIEADSSSSNLFNWRGISTKYSDIGGNIYHTNGGRKVFTTLAKNGNWVMNLIDEKGEASKWTRFVWDLESQMPRQFFAVRFVKDKDGNDIETFSQSFTRVDSPMIGWRDYPDAFHFTYHTNEGIHLQNLIVLNSTNGASFMLPAESNLEHHPDYDRRPLFSSKFLRFALFIFTFGCIGLFLWRRVLQKKQY